MRHGKDKRTKYRNDEKLTESGKLETREKTEQLIEDYGIPDIIYYSPFYRTRESTKEMKKVLKDKYNVKVKTKVDFRLGRYFSPRERRNPDIHSSTYKNGALVDENKKEFQRRVKEQFEHVKEKDKTVIWNITHSLVLLHVSHLSDISHDPHVEYLDTLIIP
jgi:broad specificity phosphatase PhoE